MDVERFEIDGPVVIRPRVFQDDRGFFTERFRADLWSKTFAHHKGFIQDNFSFSKYGVLRGLHFQFNPDQGKLVSCMQGTITDIIVDIRDSSPTFGKHVKVELSGLKPEWFWVPPGFAHGFVVTSHEGASVLYKVDQPYSPSTEGAIAWNDPDLNLDWPIEKPFLSHKDAIAPSLADYRKKYKITSC